MGLSIKARLHRLSFSAFCSLAARIADSAEAEIQWSPALGYWSMLAARRPHDPTPRTHQLRLLVTLGRTGEALALARHWTEERFQNDPALLHAATTVAVSAAQPKDAARWALRRAELLPHDPEATATAARLCRKAGRTREADRLLHTLQQNDQATAKELTLGARLDLVLDQGEDADVITEVQRLHDSGQKDILRQKARSLPKLKNRPQAHRIARLMMPVVANDTDCAAPLLRTLSQGASAAILTEAFEALPPEIQRHTAILTEYGRGLVDYGQSIQGIALIAEARAEAPDDDTLLRAHASALHKSLQWSQALPLWRDLAARQPTSSEPLIRIIDALIETGQYDAALTEADAALAAQGPQSDLLEWRARIPFAASRWNEALDAWRPLLKSAPKRPAPWYYTGMAGIRASAFTVNDALAHFASGLQHHPRHPQLLEKHAQVAERAGDYQAALGSWRRLLEHRPDNRVAWNGVSRQLMLLGRHDEAACHLEAMAQHDPRASFPASAAALNAMMQGDPSLARTFLDKALRQTRHRLDDFLERNRASNYSYSPTLEQDFYVDNEDYRTNLRKFDSFVEQTRQRKNVIVVGNSTNLIGKGMGSAIDSHDLVLRLNDFQLDGYEADTGSRTDHWMSALGIEHRAPPARLSETQALICYMRGAHFGETAAVLNRVMGLGLEQVTLLPNFVMELLNDVTYLYPSTGLRSIIFYRILGLPVTIYGFDFFKEKIEHYYDSSKDVLWASESHSIQYEYRMAFDMLVPLGEISVLEQDASAEPGPSGYMTTSEKIS